MSSNTEIHKYIDHYKKLHTSFLTFLEDSSETATQIDFIDIHKYLNDKKEFNHLLRLILNVFNYHRRDTNLIDKTEQVLQFLADSIKQTYSKNEIFEIFKSNKLILLLLIKNKITTFDKSSVQYMIEEDFLNNKNYCHFFYPEIKDLLDVEYKKVIDEQRSKFPQEMIDNFEQLRFKGENNSYISFLIRNDSVEDFISHVSHKNISVNSTLSPSIFETNPFLLEREITLIEYATFYGSIQIFQYLQMNQAELSHSLWMCAVHSKHSDLFQKLKTLNVEPTDDKFDECCIESIKCHHNEFTQFIKDNLLDDNDDFNNKNIVEAIIDSSNYYWFPSSFENNVSFYSICLNKYDKLIDLTIKENSRFIEMIIKKMPSTIFEVFTLLFYMHFSKSNEIVIENPLTGFFDLLTEIAIPPSITTIKRGIFNKFENLEKVTIASSVTSIEEFAFDGCNNLKSINISSSVNKIGDFAFSDCYSLIQISLPSSITSIGYHTFQLCRSLTQIAIPFSVTSIERSAFYGCSNLTKIFIPNSVTSIGPYAFCHCNKLRKIDIPSSVTSIKFYAFSDCFSLTEVHLPSSIDLIDEYTFNSCESLKKIEIPSSVKTIDSYAFYRCTALEEIDFQKESSLRSFEYMSFYGCSALKKVIFPSSVVAIGGSSFSKCVQLKEIQIGNSVKFIGSNAFNECNSLGVVEVPPSVTYFGVDPFDSTTLIVND